MHCLQHHNWPGNIRELENVMERAVLLSKNPLIEPEDLPQNILNSEAATAMPADLQNLSLKEALAEPEKRIIRASLEAHNWNRNETADALKLDRTTLYKKMKRYGLDM